MKKKDWTYIVVIVIISGAVSYGLSTVIIGNRKTKPLKIEVVNSISDQFIKPDGKYFNKDSLNLTKLIEIDDKGNTKPFQTEKTN